MREVYWTEYVDGIPMTYSQAVLIGLLGCLVPLGAVHLHGSVLLQDWVDFMVSQDLFQRRINSFDFSELDIRTLAISIGWAPVVICVTMGAQMMRWKGAITELSKSGTAENKAIKPVGFVVIVFIFSCLFYIVPLSNSRGIPLTLSPVLTYPLSSFLVCMLSIMWGSALQSVVASVLGSLRILWLKHQKKRF